MKKYRFYIYMALCMTLLMQSCYEDLGNYEYTTSELDAITISDEMEISSTSYIKPTFIFKVGEEVVIPIKYTINDQMLTKDQIGIEWYFGDELVSTAETLELGYQPLGNYTGLVVLTDLRYGTKYQSKYVFEVESTYTQGWAALSDHNGASMLSYIEINPNTGEYVFMDDVYAKSNEGETLSADASSMSYHIYGTSPYTYGLSIIQNNATGPIELNPQSMNPIGNVKDRFISSVDGAEFMDVAYMANAVYALTKDNKLYAREEAVYSGSIVPHASYFPASPVVVDGGAKITKWSNAARVSINFLTSWTGVLAYDELNSRLLYINGLKVTPFSDMFYANNPEPNYNGPGTDGTNVYNDITFPCPENLSGYKVLAMHTVGFDTDIIAEIIYGITPSTSVIMLLQSEADGKLYFLTFRFMDYYGMLDVDLDLFFPVPEDIKIDVDNFKALDHVGGPDHIYYFVANDGKDLYYLDAIYGTCKKIYSAQAEITAIGLGEIQNTDAAMEEFFGGDPTSFYTPYYHKFLVATKGGDITVLKVDKSVRASGNAPVLKTLSPGVGDFKYFTYMTNSTLSF